MRPRVTSVALTSGKKITPSDNVTLIVGPNNVGKSAVLAGVHHEITQVPWAPVQPPSGPVESVRVTLPDLTGMTDLIANRAKLTPPGSYSYGNFQEHTYVFDNGATLPQSRFVDSVSRSDHFGELAAGMVTFLGPEGRGNILGSQGVPDLTAHQSRSPMQLLWTDRELEKRVDEYMFRAFGKHVVVNRHAGSNVHLQIGVVQEPEPRIGETSPYLDEILALPHLHQQGAGMQAFMGTIMTLATGSFDILLIDEPETFLHPPQARLLGEIVAEMSKETGLQVLAATHSDDFVQGVIAGSKDNSDVAIVRITRPADDENHTAQIEPAAIKALYADPLLRFSKIMDGIFYKGVVLCEAESDCTYYSATLGHLEASEHLSSSDLLFAQCGGKDRLAKAHTSLNAAAVPTAVIADIDMLANKAKFKELFETMGGDFASIEASYNVLDSSVANQRVQPERSLVSIRSQEVLSSGDQKFLIKSEIEELRNLIKAESGWRQIKGKGAGSIDSGDPTNAFNSIIAACKNVGLFVLTVGELERFHPDVSGNKQEWLRKVLETNKYRHSSEAQELLHEVLGWIASKQ